MKKKSSPLLGLLISFFILSCLTGVYNVLPPAKATYVWGTITHDTDWTLVDNPFIISDNITVVSGATLTIEPGVQVRFGQDFSIIVNGGIVADGTVDRPILFTSNNLNAITGDWGTILINGAQQSSITNCTIEYGTSGITLQSGSLNLQNNIITSNMNGTVVNGGSATIENNMMVNNTACGINIVGGSQVTVENNTISSNGDGVVLTGNLNGAVDVTQNNIMLNINSGISLGAAAYSDTSILQNNVSSNSYGFLVTSNDTYIAHNYISNNTVDGILYQDGTGHQAHFNDIYSNAVGMDIYSNNVTDPSYIVNATYNYWGDPSGPSHAYLNPYGKGNSVGGNGIGLHFIFFLSKPSDFNNTPPTAVLQTDKTLVAPDQNVTFIGTNSYDDGRVDQYFYDFGDGVTSGWTTLSLTNHTYANVGTYMATLTVMDDFGTISQNPTTTTITVQNLTPLSVSIAQSSQVADYNGNVTVTVYVANQNGAVQNAAVTLLSLKGGSFLANSGTTDSTGQFQTTFTAPNVTDVSNIRLIATATEAGYADGSTHTYLEVLPLLHIQVTTKPATVKSEATVNMIFLVYGGLGQPVANASITATADNGTLSQNAGVTGSDGTVTFNFTAPYTLNPIIITINTTAEEQGFTSGQDQQAIVVLQNNLAVAITPNENPIVSEGSTKINVLATCDGTPISNATVTASADTGNLTSTIMYTDTNGFATFLYNAPQTTSALNATLTVTATKSHYIDGTNQISISVTPKLLILYLTAQNYTMISEANVTITAHVTYNSAPVQDANVTIASTNGGNFSQLNGTTDANGFATFNFIAPQANVSSNINITAVGSKTGYVDGQDHLMLNVIPGNLTVQITPSSYAIMPGRSTVVTVTATANSKPVANAQVIMSTTNGNFSYTVGFTDANGTCSFVFNAPETTVQLNVTMNTSVSKNGYFGGSNQTSINVVPVAPISSQPGFPWLMLMLIVVPVIIAVVVVVLIKSKILVISAETEEGTSTE